MRTGPFASLSSRRPPPSDPAFVASGGGPPSPLPLPPGLLSGLHPGGLFMHSAAAAAAAAAASSAEEPVTSASPLQRMASITNSLMSSAAMPPMPPHPTRPAKAVLPPITQQQFDQYSNINTEQVVKRVSLRAPLSRRDLL